MATEHLQIWNNAAFDDGGSVSKPSPSPVSPPLHPVSTNARGAPIDFDPSKENRSPVPAARASAPPKKAAVRVAFREDAEVEDADIEGEIARVEEEIAQLRLRLEGLQVKKADREARAAAGRVRGRIVSAKFLEPKQSAARNPCTPVSKRVERPPEAAPGSAGIRRRGMSMGPLEIFATPVRPLGPKRSAAKNLWPSALKKKIEDCPAPSAKMDRRGVSLGPLEIHGKLAMRQSSGAINKTPLPSVQSSKKADTPNLDGIEEEKGAKNEKERTLNPKPQPPSAAKRIAIDAKKVAETPSNAKLRRRGASLGPADIAAGANSRRPNNMQLEKEKAVKVDKQPVKRNSSMSPMHQQPSAAKASAVRKTTATVVDKKATKEEGQASGRFRTKSLFQETASCKRLSKTPKARVVASRYSLACARAAADEPGSKRRKWSLPELSREKANAASSVTGSSGSLPDCNISQGSEQEEQVKTDLQESDTSDIEMSCPSLAQSSPPSIMKVAELLPKIKTFRSTVDDSPRDSGCAKRAADLAGKKSFFAEAKDEELNSPSQAVTFLDE